MWIQADVGTSIPVRCLCPGALLSRSKTQDWSHIFEHKGLLFENLYSNLKQIHSSFELEREQLSASQKHKTPTIFVCLFLATHSGCEREQGDHYEKYNI